jgi:hypothetical protein
MMENKADIYLYTSVLCVSVWAVHESGHSATSGASCARHYSGDNVVALLGYSLKCVKMRSG